MHRSSTQRLVGLYPYCCETYSRAVGAGCKPPIRTKRQTPMSRHHGYVREDARTKWAKHAKNNEQASNEQRQIGITKGRTTPRNDNMLRTWQLETVEFALRAQMRAAGSGRANNYRDKSGLGNSCTEHNMLEQRETSETWRVLKKIAQCEEHTTKNANGSFASSERIKRSQCRNTTFIYPHLAHRLLCIPR